MIKRVPIVIFLPFCDLALFRVSRVVEAGIIKLPSDAARTGSIDSIGEQVAGCSLNYAQRADFRATGRGPISDVLTIFRCCPPVKSNGSVRRERIHIHQRSILALQPFANQQHELVLRAFALRIKIIFAANLRSGNRSDREQLLQTLMEFTSSRQRVKDTAGISELLAYPLLRLWALGVLKPTISIRNCAAMKNFFHRLLFSRRRAGRR